MSYVRAISLIVGIYFCSGNESAVRLSRVVFTNTPNVIIGMIFLIWAGLQFQLAFINDIRKTLKNFGENAK